MNPIDLSDTLTSPLVPAWGWRDWCWFVKNKVFSCQMQTEQRTISIYQKWVSSMACDRCRLPGQRDDGESSWRIVPNKSYFTFHLSVSGTRCGMIQKLVLQPHICSPPQLFKWLHRLAAFSERCSVINGLFMSLWSHYKGISQTTIFKHSCWIVVKKGRFYLFYVFLYDYG